MTDFNFQTDASNTDRTAFIRPMHGHPDEVLTDQRLTLHEKRALLASWASDANAVAHLPRLRQLPDGSILSVDEILRALRSLDASIEPERKSPVAVWRPPFNRRRRSSWRIWSRDGRGPDDDDPPPCPAIVAVGPRSGGGAAFALAEPVEA